MKTSKILTAMVLPAMLAACTAEDIVTNGANNMVQSERPLLSEDFRLISEGEGQGVDSRFYMAGSSTLETVYENGDKYGAALIDVYDPANKTKPEDWKVIPSLAGNTPFIYDGAAKEWKAVAATGVGHYLFSFPYNINDQNRAAVSWEIPAIQELYGKDGKLDLNATINNYNKSVAAALLKENATTHATTMRNLYSYPKFVVKFDNGLPITTVSQVVLELATENNTTERLFTIKGGFDHIGVAKLFDEKAIAEKVGKDKVYATKDEYWASKQTTDFIIDGDAYDDYSAADLNTYAPQENTTSKYIVAKLPENTKVTKDSDNNKCVEVRFMIPGDVMDEGGLYDEDYNLNMYVYTNNGVYVINNVYNGIDFKSTTPAETKNRVFARNASYTLNLKKDAPVKAQDELYIVTNVKDWNDLVNKYGASAAYDGADALKVAVVGDNFILDATAKMPTKADFAVTTDITIDGNVTLQNVFVESNKVIVKKGATLNIADNTNKIGTVENYGTLNFKKAVASRAAEVVEMINTVSNVDNMPNATLNIEEDAEADFYLYNKYDNETLEHGKVFNNGVLKTKGNNDGEIENNGTTIIDGEFKTWFKHTIGVYGEESYKEHTPAFFNNGVFVADGATYKNKGNFFNDATGNVSCAGGAAGVFANEGYAKATKEGTFLITSNTGTIELDEINQGKWSLETMGGTILYNAKSTDTSLSFATSAVTKLVVGNQNMTISATGQLNDITMGTGTLTLPKYNSADTDADENDANDTDFNGVLTVKGDVVIASELANMDGLIIEEDASLTINKNNKVQTETVNNLGAVLVAGQFVATVTTEEDAVKNEKGEIVGVFKSTQGSTNNIDFGDTDEEKAAAEAEAEAKEAFEAAMVNAVKYWILTETESFAGGYSLADTKYDLKATDEDDEVIAADMFVKYHAAAIGWNYGTKDGLVGTVLNEALETYQNYQAATTIKDAFSAAVETILAEFAAGGIDTNEDGEVEENEILYVNDLTKLAWAPEVRVYLDDAADVKDGKTAEEKALEALKAAVVAGEVTDKNEALSRVQKVLLNTDTTTETVAEVVPAQSIVFAEDAIYKIFGDNAIGLLDDWSKALGDDSEAYAATVGSAPSWTMDKVIAWINDVASKKTEENLFIDMAKEYLKENSIITESKTWKYSDDAIQQIVMSYGRLEAVNVGTVEELTAAIAGNKSVKLTADITNLTAQLNVNGNVTIDLNGHKLANNTSIWNPDKESWSLISVQNGTLTITGEGELISAENDCYTIDVRNGAALNIESGKFIGNISAVYVIKGIANISGGEFDLQQLEGKEKAVANGWSSQYSGVLNCKNENSETGKAVINVTGGKYHNFNPCNTANKDKQQSYLPVSGYHVKCTNSNNAVTEPETRAYAQEWLDGNVTAVYEVIKK